MTTITVNIANGSFPSIKIPPGTSVRWKNLDQTAHSAETDKKVKDYFNAGPMRYGQTSTPVTFRTVGEYPYLCRFHHGMTGKIVVHDGPIEIGPPDHDHGHHFEHFHGFVTGGRTASALFLTHTPILADTRHHFQIILRASLPEPEVADAYNAIRSSAYADGKIDIFHGHVSLLDIRDGKLNELPEAEIYYHPEGAPYSELPGLETPKDTKQRTIKVKIDEVLFFHTFELDKPYPDSLEYLVYGDSDDIFLDHAIDRAPSFHSVAKLSKAPAFWKGSGVQRISVPSKRMIDSDPVILDRGAVVDNAYSLFWLPPAGLLRPEPIDPLQTRDNSPAIYECSSSDGTVGQLEISRFLHFDYKLLNYGVLIPYNNE